MSVTQPAGVSSGNEEFLTPSCNGTSISLFPATVPCQSARTTFTTVMIEAIRMRVASMVREGKSKDEVEAMMVTEFVDGEAAAISDPSKQ